MQVNWQTVRFGAKYIDNLNMEEIPYFWWVMQNLQNFVSGVEYWEVEGQRRWGKCRYPSLNIPTTHCHATYPDLLFDVKTHNSKGK